MAVQPSSSLARRTALGLAAGALALLGGCVVAPVDAYDVGAPVVYPSTTYSAPYYYDAPVYGGAPYYQPYYSPSLSLGIYGHTGNRWRGDDNWRGNPNRWRGNDGWRGNRGNWRGNDGWRGPRGDRGPNVAPPPRPNVRPPMPPRPNIGATPRPSRSDFGATGMGIDRRGSNR